MRRRRRWRIVRAREGALALVLALLITAAASAAPARISLTRDTDAGGGTRITAAVTDGSGQAVAGAPLAVLVKTAFGWLRLAEVKTGADGRAVALLPPQAPYSEVRVQSDEDPEIHAGLLLRPADRPAPARRPGPNVLRALSPQPGFLSPYPPVQIAVVAAILGGVWTTYAYLVTLLIRIRRSG